MLGECETFTDIAVKDLAVSKQFYEGVLGLTVDHEDDWEVVYKSGSTKVHTYKSEFAGTNKATYMSWVVGDDIGAKAEELKGKGVSFERYDMPGVTMEGDVHVMGETKAAWFKDPDGNILCLSSESA